MTYLLACSALFSVLSIHRSTRFEWCTLAVMTFVNFILTCQISSESNLLYWLVSVVTLAGTMTLIRARSTLGYYQAIVLMTTMCAYGALAWDVSQGRHVLIYNNYEAVIYGLVGCQLIAVLPTIRAVYRDLLTGCVDWFNIIQRDTKS